MSKKKTEPEGQPAQFFWRPGVQIKLDPALAGAELQRIIQENGNRVDAARIVQEAASPMSPLHEGFEWDDSKAAHEHRLWQARHLAGALQFRTVDQKNRPIIGRMFLQVSKPEGGRTKDYALTTYVLSQPDLRAEALRTALLELAAFRRKYADLSELAQVIRVIDVVEKEARKHG